MDAEWIWTLKGLPKMRMGIKSGVLSRIVVLTHFHRPIPTDAGFRLNNSSLLSHCSDIFAQARHMKCEV